MTEVFAIAPAPARTLWFLGGTCAVLLLVAALLAWVRYFTQHSRVEVGADRLQLSGDLWGRSIPLGALGLRRAQEPAGR